MVLEASLVGPGDVIPGANKLDVDAGLGTTPAWIAESDQAAAYFGHSVSTAGDVNGDSYADIVVGAARYDSGLPDEGRAFVYYGNEGPGFSLTPRQRREDDSGPIAHLGRAEGNAFRLAALGRTPFGRGKVKLEWEVKPLGTPFDGSGTGQSATWIDTGTAGAQLNELVSDLRANTAYHWRLRLRYHPATTPLQRYSRWLTMPWNGWAEQDLRTGPPTADFSSATYSVAEGAGTAAVIVTLDAPSGLTVTVDYATSDGTAEAPADYIAISDTLTFLAGDTSETFEMTLADDELDEEDETVILTLSGASNAAIGSINPATLIILDDDAYIYLPLVLHVYPQ